jgi:hypothetical protein
MRKEVDYETIASLLEDESLSLNEVARITGCSSWSVRKFARDLAGDTRPMKTPRVTASERANDGPASESESLGGCGWIVLGVIAAAFVVLCFVGPKRDPGDWPAPPYRPESEPM